MDLSTEKHRQNQTKTHNHRRCCLEGRGLMKWGLVSNCCSRETAAAADLADHTSAEIGVWIETHTHSIMFLYMEYLHNRVESKALSHILNITWKVDIKWESQSTHYWVQEPPRHCAAAGSDTAHAGIRRNTCKNLF